MPSKVTKSQAELYQVRSGQGSLAWGDITLICGPHSVSVMARSDYGSFDHHWSHCGGEPKGFLCGLDFQYTMKKLTNGKLYVPYPEGYEKEIKESIIDSRKADGLTRDQARTAWDEMLSIHDEYNGGDLFFQALYEHEFFDKVFVDCEGMPSAKKPCGRAVDFYNDVWTPFIAELKKEAA
ncbi:MAG: hypothetical protein JKX67_07310 [Colwellia sp.]|nr:hypothetical protein [Colwellia sp.]